MAIWDELEIAPTVEVAAIRRAYADKLKRTRPDDDPAGFMRLRAAYDAALAQASHGAPPAEPKTPSAPIPTPSQASSSSVFPTPEAFSDPTAIEAQAKVIKLLTERRVIEAAKALQAEVQRGELSLAAQIELTDGVLLGLVNERDIDSADLIDVAKSFDWYSGGGGGGNPRREYVIRQLHARLDAEEWLSRVQSGAKSVDLWLLLRPARASALFLGRGPIGFGLARLLPPEPPLRRLYLELQLHNPWIAHKLDAQRITALGTLAERAKPAPGILRYVLPAAAFIGAGAFAMADLPTGAAGWLVAIVGLAFFRTYRSDSRSLWQQIRTLSYARYARGFIRLAFGLAVLGNFIFHLVNGFDARGPLDGRSMPAASTVDPPRAAVDTSISTLEARAENADHAAAYELAERLFNGKGVQQDVPEAAKWYLVCEQDYPQAAFTLGYLYESGWGVRKDYSLARIHYQRAESADPRAAVNLARLLKDGLGGPADPVRAFDLFQHAAKAGNALAATYVGSAYQTGTGVPKDPRTGLKWFTAAAEAGDTRAAYLLGEAYLSGVGAAIDASRAYRWLSIADRHYPLGDPERAGIQQALHRASERLTPTQRDSIDSGVDRWSPETLRVPD